jgi:hypothetical protein
MSVINATVTRTRDQLTENLRLAETMALAAVDVVESAVSLAVPVALAAVPDRERWLARADEVVGQAFSASREALSGAYSGATQAVDSLAARLAA